MTNSQRQRSHSTALNQIIEDEDHIQQHGASPSAHDQHEVPPAVDAALAETSPPNPGFLGSTSYSAVFTEGKQIISLESLGHSHEMNVRGWRSPTLPDRYSLKVKQGVEVLSFLSDIHVYTPALSMWYQCQSVEGYVPYVRDCIDLLPPKIRDGCKDEIFLLNMSHKIFRKTSTPSPLKADIKLHEYPKFLMGENISWEIVGLILTVAGLAAISVDEVNIFSRLDPQISWKSRAQDLVHAGDECIAFFEEFGHLKDIGVTLIAMNFILHTQVYGDADYHCWRKLGRLTTAIFALGLHEESKAQMPLFLLELHRKTFWFAYICDKYFATFFGRPPMINGKFCSCKMPLDLEYYQLGLEGEALEGAFKDLDSDGWNIMGWSRGRERPTLLRVGIISSQLREEILEISLGTDIRRLYERARELKSRLRLVGASLPLRLREHPDSWLQTRSVPENCSQLSRHVDFVYNEFLLERTLVKRLGESPAELVKVSRSLLSIMLVVIGHRHQQGLWASDLPYMIVLYALPPAGVLALELLHHSRSKRQPSYDFPRPEIIQNLSNLVSSIDYIVRPTNGNYEICGQAKKMLQAILDTILSPEYESIEAEDQAANTTESFLMEGLADPVWLDNDLDIDFWTSLENHPLLAWPEVPAVLEED